MIPEILRSALVLGTVLMQMSGTHASAGVTMQEPAGAAAISASASMTPTAPVMTTARPLPSRLLMRHVDLHLPKMKDVRSGVASWYGRMLDRRRTANGEMFDSEKLTGASNTLPMGTQVKVTNLKNGQSVVVRVNDRGLMRGRVIDLSTAAAKKIGMLKMGLAPVRLDVLAAEGY